MKSLILFTFLIVSPANYLYAQFEIKLTADDRASEDWFGCSVTIDDDVVVIGALGDDLESIMGTIFNAGSAYVFNWNRTDWIKSQKLIASDRTREDNFAQGLAMSRDFILVGAAFADWCSGQGYIFKREGSVWIEQDILIPGDNSAYDGLGKSVSVDGEYAVLGAMYTDNMGGESGSAYIFKYNGAAWEEEKKLLASDGSSFDYFGSGVSICGNEIVVGAWNDDDNGDNSGSAYIFKRDDSGWKQVQKLTASDGAEGDLFGSCVSFDQDFIVIGATYANDANGENAGAAYVFKRVGTSWIEHAKLLAAGGHAEDHFGISVSICGDYIAVGAYDDDYRGENSGAVYIFKNLTHTWALVAKLTASDAQPGDEFGNSVCISGNHVVVGAHMSDVIWKDTGAAYIYDLSLLQPLFSQVMCGDIINDDELSMGCSWIDFNNDCYLDLFVANSGRNNLYSNNGDGTFTKITDVCIVTDENESFGCTWGDFDNDDNPDLFISNFEDENNALFKNCDNGQDFCIVQSQVDDGGWSSGCCWFDSDKDGYLDLFVSNAQNFDNGQNQNNFFYKNVHGELHKIDEGILVQDNGFSYGCSCTDFDNDEDLDLFVANLGQNFLYRNNADGTFIKVTDGDIVNDVHQSIGCCWGDYDNDGDLDLFVANIEENNDLYSNNGDGSFTKIVDQDLANDGGFSVGSCWGDYDNDGDLDLFVSNYWDEHNFLYENNGDATFKKVNDPIIVLDEGYSTGCCWGDFDNDGDLDLFVAAEGKNRLYQNNGNDNHWLNIKCVGTASNRSAIGAKVRAKALIGGRPVWQLREISGQTGFGTQNSLNVEFGFGDADMIDSLVVVWPSGLIQVWEDMQANQFLTLTEGSDAIPVELALFAAHVNGHDVTLEWVTESERNNYGFEIECKSEQAWERIGFVKGHGTTATRHAYSCKDSDVAPGSYHYRLRQIDTDGGSQYSQELEVQIGPLKQFGLDQNYPNPFNAGTTIQFTVPHRSLVKLAVYNLMGREVALLVNEELGAGVHKVDFDANDIGSGLYYYRFETSEFSQTKKLVVLK